MAVAVVFDLLVGAADLLESFGVGVRRRLFDGLQVGLADALVIRVGRNAKNKIRVHRLKWIAPILVRDRAGGSLRCRYDVGEAGVPVAQPDGTSGYQSHYIKIGFRYSRWPASP